MASPYGFSIFKTLNGYSPAVVEMPMAASQTIAAGDAVIKNSDGYIAIAVENSSTSLYGVALTGAVTSASQNTKILIAVFDSNTVFVGYCSGNSAQTLVGLEVDIDGATGTFQIDENATTQALLHLIDIHPTDDLGATGRMLFMVPQAKSSFLGVAV